jgi:hypothetical protein
LNGVGVNGVGVNGVGVNGVGVNGVGEWGCPKPFSFKLGLTLITLST